jgi:hypothetical protein
MLWRCCHFDVIEEGECLSKARGIIFRINVRVIAGEADTIANTK